MLRFLGRGAHSRVSSVCPVPIHESRLRSATKRAIDIAGALLLIVVAAPALLVISALVKITSRGSVLFAHRRVGRYGTRFSCFKFRTMYADRPLSAKEAERFAVSFKLQDDPRVTPVGRFLRRSSLDELPQLWNVACGTMSLVGPRPLVEPELSSHYSAEARERLLSVRPGLTGPWQISGRPRVDYPERATLEAGYASTSSLRGDLLTILKTAWGVVSLRGSG